MEEERWEEEKRREWERLESMKLSEQERNTILEVNTVFVFKRSCKNGGSRNLFLCTKMFFFSQGLRTNWSELHHQYQRLSLLTDTLPKKIRRGQIEGQLDELEKFVSLIDKHPVIVISDDPFFGSY